MLEVYGQLIRAQLQISATDLSPTATGLIYFNTNTGVKWYNGTAWKTAADLDSSQTLLNKLISSTGLTTGALALPSGTEAERPATPNAGWIRFNNETQQFEGYKSGAWSSVAPGTTDINPTAMDNVNSTRGGYKEYSSNTAYNGGIVPRMTNSAGGNPTISKLLPYQTQSGSWRLKANCLSHTASGYSFGTGFNSTTNKILRQSDGKLVVAGSFTTYQGTTRNYLVRINTDGTVDTSFYTNLGTGFNATVYDVALQSDGKIICIGSFTLLNGTSRPKIVRLNSDGTVDTTFQTNIGSGFTSDGTPLVLTLQSDGKILIGGSFIVYKAVTRNGIVRLNSDGNTDGTFVSGTGFVDNFSATNGINQSISVQSDGKIVCAGMFDTYNGSDVTIGPGYGCLARLNSNGTLDTAFKSGIGSGLDFQTYLVGVNSANVLSDGRILLSMGSDNQWNGASRGDRRLLCLSSNGSIHATDANLGTFPIGPDRTIQLTDGSIVVSMDGISYAGNTRNFIVKLNSDLTEDVGFYTNISPGFGGAGGNLRIAEDATHLIMSGGFTTLAGNTANSIARVSKDGTPVVITGTATNFTETINGVVFDATAAQAVVHSNGGVIASTAQTVPNTGSIQILAASAISNVSWTLDVALASKPSWAY